MRRVTPRLPLLLVVVALGPAAASAQVDPSGEWRTLHTAHFRIHFRPAYRPVAHDAAGEAERAYALLARELRPPQGRIDITLADDVDASNGYASPYPSNRLTVFLAPPTADPGLQPFDSWLRLVIAHELTHVFHLDRTRGLWRVPRALLGRVPGTFPNGYQPSWVAEGLATYYESRLSGGGRLRGTYHPQILAADVAAGGVRSPWDAVYFTRWNGGVTPYAYGARFFGWVARAAGDSAVPRFVETAAGQLIPFRVGRPLRRAGAVTALDSAWGAAVRGAVPAVPGATAGTALVPGLWADPAPAVAPDGRRVAYLVNDGRRAPRLIVARASDLAPLRARVVNGNVTFDWVGDTLVVAQLDFTARWRIRSDLYQWLPDGTWRRLTHGARATQPGGGGALVALFLEPGDNRPGLPSAPDGPGVLWGAVVPSRDGRFLAATRHVHGEWALVRWPAAAPESLVVLFESGATMADPAWEPGGAIDFVWEGSGLPQVYRWTPGGVVALTADPQGARSPSALPDGSLLYSALGHGGWELRRATPGRRAAVAGALPPRFVPAPLVPLRETGYAAWPSLRPHFWLPLFEDAGAAGWFAGGGLGGGDALGRFGYSLTALAAADPWRAQGGVGLTTAVLGNPTLDLALSSDWFYAGRTSGGADVSARDVDAVLGASFVRRRWRSSASVRVAAEYEGVRFTIPPGTVLAARDLVGGSVTLGLSRYVTAPLAVSAQSGFAWNLTYERREEQGGQGWSDELRSRVTLLLRLPRAGFAHPVLALRVAAGASRGPVAGRFSVGGVSSGRLALFFARVGGPTRDFPLRGYDGGTQVGRRALTGTAELRLPLALVGRSLGRLPVGADKLGLRLFVDAGHAWDPGAVGQGTQLRSVGAELVADLTYNYDAALRLRLGLAAPLEGRPARFYAALGTEL